MNDVAIDDLETRYARFNALKTFSTLAPSQFEQVRIGQLIVTRDPARPDSYYNRILGLSAATAHELGQAISWIEDAVGSGAELRVDVAFGHGCNDLLVDAGLKHDDTILWLQGNDTPAAVATTTAQVLRLTPDDRPALRELLEAHGGIADDLWAMRSSYLCTDAFRWFAIFERNEVVSAASVWIDAGIAIFGSAFTRESHRGQGYQLELLNHRRATTPGMHYVDVTPDSTSHRNCRRAGFADLERRQVWVRKLET